MDEHYNKKHKKIMITANFLLLFYVFSSIFLVSDYNITDFSIGYTNNINPFLSIIVSNLVTAFLCTYLIFALIQQNNREKSIIKEILIFFFMFSAIPSYILGFHYIFAANDSILVEYNLISPQFLIPGATLFLAYFVIEIFDREMKIFDKKIRIIEILSVVACALNFSYMFFGIGPDKALETAAVINYFYYLLILPLYAFFYILLLVESMKLMKKIEEKLYRQGIMYLGISGALLGVIYLVRILFFLNPPPNILAWDIIKAILDYGSLAGYILLYMGIILPSKQKGTKSGENQPSKMMVKIIEMQQKEKLKKQHGAGLQSILKTREEFEKTGKMMKVAKNIIIEKMSINGIDAELLSPKSSSSPKVILYLHGGGYLYCSINTHRGLASLIADQTQIPVLIIEYQRAPENKFPAALDDTLTVYDWLLTSKLYSQENIIFGGDSAGGGLAMATLLKMKELRKPLPKAAFLISPWLDLTFSGDSFENKKDLDAVLDQADLKLWAQSYLGDQDAKNPYVSPLFGDLANLPPIFIQVGTSEMLFNDSTRLFEKLKEKNNKGEILIWDQLIHAFPLFAAIKFIGKFIPESNEAIVKIKQFLDKIYA